MLTAQEGSRLLNAGDYKGAIAACTDAIWLEPGSIGAYRAMTVGFKLDVRRLLYSS